MYPNFYAALVMFHEYILLSFHVWFYCEEKLIFVDDAWVVSDERAEKMEYEKKMAKSETFEQT